MINQTIEKLYEMKLGTMAKGFQEQFTALSGNDLSFEERFAMIVDQEYTARENRKLEKRLRRARLKQQASIEDIDFRHPRCLDRQVILSLANCEWLRQHHNVVIIGPTGIGKSYIAEALGNKACREGFNAQRYRSTELLRELEAARADGSYARFLNKLKKMNPLIVDDFVVYPMSDDERRNFFDVMEDRYGVTSTILTSQYPISEWHQLIGSPTLADAILDRIVHNTHRIELNGESMRKGRSLFQS